MGIFNRRTQAADADTTSSTGNGPHNRRAIMSQHDRRYKPSASAQSNGALNTRPSFGQWLKVTWPDILTMVIMGIVGLGVSSSGMLLLLTSH